MYKLELPEGVAMTTPLQDARSVALKTSPQAGIVVEVEFNEQCWIVFLFSMFQQCYRPPQAKPQVRPCKFVLMMVLVHTKNFYLGLQLQKQASGKQGSQPTGASIVGADEVSKTTKMPIATPTTCKRGSSGSEMSRAKVHVWRLP